LFALVADEINYGLIGVICLPEEVGKYDNLLSNDWINRSDLFFQKKKERSVNKIGAICFFKKIERFLIFSLEIILFCFLIKENNRSDVLFLCYG